MPSNYPTGLDNLNEATNPGLTHRNVAEAIEAIQSTLGVDAGVWKSWVPGITATSNPNLGASPTLGGRYAIIGKIAVVIGTINCGASGTTVGSGVYSYNVPVNIGSILTNNEMIGSGFMYDTSSGALSGLVAIKSSATGFSMFFTGGQTGGALSSGYGNVTNGRHYRFNLTYEI